MIWIICSNTFGANKLQFVNLRETEVTALFITTKITDILLFLKNSLSIAF